MQLIRSFSSPVGHGRRCRSCTSIHASLRPGPLCRAFMRAEQPGNRQRSVTSVARRASRGLRSQIRAALPQHEGSRSDQYAPFSVELLLAVARLGHLERYRQEIQMFYEPGLPADLTRCALLISNIYNPQLDHRPYYTCLEDLAASAALEAVNRLSTHSTHGRVAVKTDGAYALDPSNPQHLLYAITAINHVLFTCEGLSVNTVDSHDPLNGSLADVMDRKLGNQYTLAVIYQHVAAALGLYCTVIGSPEHLLIRVGHPSGASSSDGSNNHYISDALNGIVMSYLVDISTSGTVYKWPRKPHTSSSSSRGVGSGPGVVAGAVPQLGPEDQPAADDGQWQKDLLAWLRQQQQRQALDDSQSFTHDVGQFSNTHETRSYAPEEASMLGSSSSSLSSIDSFAVDDDGSVVHGWQQVEGYAAADAASRNSWKALYGPGALSEWGGLVSSSSSSSSDLQQQAVHDRLQAASQGGNGNLPSVKQAAANGLKAYTVSASSSNKQASSDSMDTCCSDSEQENASEADTDCDMDSCDADTSAVPSLASNSTDAGAGCQSVWELPGADVGDKYGGLQPVSSRVLLQQMLSGMKLSLTLSGRNQEALTVTRYLRATDPFSLPDLRDEGLLLAQMEQHEPAVALLREYLAVAPGAADAEMVREVLEQQLLAVQLARSRARRQQQ